MQLKSFQYFIAIAEHATLSAAADAVFVSQPALSQQIRKIEEEVGAALFWREGHSMKLTPAGEVFLQCARRILQSYEAMKREVQVLDQAAQGIVPYGDFPFLFPSLSSQDAAQISGAVSGIQSRHSGGYLRQP